MRPNTTRLLASRTRVVLTAAAVLLALFASLHQMYFVPTVQAVSTSIVISQVYGGGGNTGATLKNDFIEIFNRGNAPVSVTGWSLQYASSAGSTWQRTDLTGTIQPGQYFLVQEAAGTGGTVNLPTPDATGNIAMSATSGKVALVTNQTLLTCGSAPGNCFPNAAIQDFVGYGSSANNFEGSGPTATLSNTTAALRADNGCTDTDNNASDFSSGAPNPRNTSAPLNPCGGLTLTVNDVAQAEGASGAVTFSFTVTLSAPAPAGGVTFDIATADGTAQDGNPAGEDTDYVAKSEMGRTISPGNSSATFTVTVNGDTAVEPDETFFVNVSNVSGASVSDGQGLGTITNDEVTITPINQIQGSGTSSPLVTQSVTTTGIVTGRRSNGFFIQTPDGAVDADSETSEGILVFTSSAPPAVAAVGNFVQVGGTVTEFVPSQDLNSPPETEITSPTVTLLSSGNPLPAPVLLSAAETTAPSETSDPLDTMEEYEGMRVSVASLTVIAPTSGNISESNATATSNGVFYGVVTGVPRPFREPGINVSDPIPPPMPLNVPRFDENPERLRVDSDAQPPASAINVTTGTVISNIIGPLDYAFRTYTILPDPGTPPVVGTLAVATPVPDPATTEFTVASFNTFRFYDTVNDSGVSDVALTATAYSNRLNKMSLVIRNVMRTPDVIGVQEIEKLSVLQDIANRVNADAVAAGNPDPQYAAYLEEGNDIGGIDVGFLVKTSRITVVDVTQEGKDATFINPNNGQPELLNDRPPLILRATIPSPTGSTLAFTVIVNHLRSLNGVDDPVDGNRVRTKRRAGAEFLANLIQSRQSTDPNEKIIVLGDMNAFQFNDGFVDVIGTIKGTPAPADQVVLASGDLVNPDLTDLVDTLPADQRYSFIFDGNAQVLDHVIVNQSALALNTGFSYARNNADFPVVYYGVPTRPERVSDHDIPVAYFTFPPPSVDLSLAKTDSPDPVVTGSDITYTITVTNNGIDNATDVVVTDNLPSETVFVSCDATGSGVCGGAGNNRTVTFSSLPIGASETITLVATVNCEVANGFPITNTATAVSAEGDPNTGNNSQTVTTTASNPPPTITLTTQPITLSPPNHKYQTVSVNDMVLSASDNCDPNVNRGAVVIAQVTSDEPENAPGNSDGDTLNDIVIASDCRSVRLRAERDSNLNGRVYTVTLKVTDSSGNVTTATRKVTVPISPGRGEAIDSGPVYTVTAECP